MNNHRSKGFFSITTTLKYPACCYNNHLNFWVLLKLTTPCFSQHVVIANNTLTPKGVIVSAVVTTLAYAVRDRQG
jgi:hypothetical protein